MLDSEYNFFLLTFNRKDNLEIIHFSIHQPSLFRNLLHLSDRIDLYLKVNDIVLLEYGKITLEWIDHQ